MAPFVSIFHSTYFRHGQMDEIKSKRSRLYFKKKELIKNQGIIRFNKNVKHLFNNECIAFCISYFISKHWKNIFAEESVTILLRYIFNLFIIGSNEKYFYKNNPCKISKKIAISN